MKVQVEKKATLAGHRDCIYTLEGSDKPNIFFSAAGDGMVVKWDLETPDIGALLAKVNASVYAMCFVPQYNHLIIGENFDGLHIIDLGSNKEIRSLKMTTSAIFDIKVFDDKIIVACGDGLISIVDYKSLEVKQKIKYSDKSARCISINYGCKEIAIGYSDHFIRVYDLHEYKLKYEFLAHENSVFTVVYSPDSRYLLSGGRDAKLKKWEVFNGYSLNESVAAHMYAINHLTFSPDAANFVTCSMDKSIKVWDANEMKLLKVIDRGRHAGHGTSINKLLWTTYHNQLISCSDDRKIGVWDIIFNNIMSK